jgi:glycosyltransferase 2 family protein
MLLATAGIWFAWLILREWQSFAQALAAVELSGLILVLLFGLLAHLPYAVLFWWQLRVIEGRPASFLLSARMLFVGQVIRYLPGRFWHLVYQASVTHSLLPGNVLVRVNLEYMAVVSWAALGVSLAILASSLSFLLAICIYFSTVVGIVLGFRYAWHSRIFGLVAMLFPHGRVRNAVASIGTPTPREWSASFVALAVLCCVWSSYIAGWVMLGFAWPALAELDLVRLCALYTLAWFIGFITMIAPAGIGVRELTFAWLAPGVPPETLVLLALVVRVWLTLVELLLFVMVLPVRVKQPANAASQGET